jgi:Flp pilus assembly protein TadG
VRAVRARARGQTLVFAAIAMVAMVGGVALVIDLGVFFVIEKQMQSAADAAALAAVWYEPVCIVPTQTVAGCQSSAPLTPVRPPCDGARPDGDALPCAVAVEFAERNLGAVRSMCGGPEGSGGVTVNPYWGAASRNPSVNVYIVAIDCDARYWFGRIIPTLPMTRRIAVNAAATIGWRGDTGDVVSTLPTPLPAPLPTPEPRIIARLVRTT